jgi:hypothetical protein
MRGLYNIQLLEIVPSVTTSHKVGYVFVSVGYVFLLLCLRILTLFCIFCLHRANWHFPATLTEGFPCFFLSCKANARVYIAKTKHGPHFS